MTIMMLLIMRRMKFYVMVIARMVNERGGEDNLEKNINWHASPFYIGKFFTNKKARPTILALSILTTKF